MAKYGVRPSRGLSLIGAVIGIGMLLVVVSVLSDSDGSMEGAGKGFLALWVIGLICVIGYHIFNATTGKGHAEVVENLTGPNEDHRQSVEKSLEELMRSREREEISAEEFDARRVEILDSQPRSRSGLVLSDQGRSVEERLQRLDSLRQKGLVSEEEYRSKRLEIIDSL